MPVTTAPARLPRLDRRGVALPIALLGLVVVSLLVTAALLTSSTELALSSAQRDGSRALYQADAAIERFVAERAAAGVLLPDTTYASPDPAYTIRVTRLANQFGNNSGAAWQRETFSMVANPVSGRGRLVGAMVVTTRSAAMLKTNISAGATSGGDVKVQGNATISNGRGTACGDTAKNALEVTKGSKVTLAGNPNIVGRIDTTSYTKDSLVARVLGGTSLDTLAKYAQIKFGPRFGKPSFTGRVNADATTAKDYNWGCPAGMGITCAAKDTANYPLVGIDAGGGTVTINGDYGQGILVVVNGSLALQGNMVYKGIILVEKDLAIGGGQGQFDGKIQGAVVALGQSSTVEDNVGGTAVITYDRCSIDAAQDALNRNALANQPQAFNAGTFAWFEVVR